MSRIPNTGFWLLWQHLISGSHSGKVNFFSVETGKLEEQLDTKWVAVLLFNFLWKRNELFFKGFVGTVPHCSLFIPNIIYSFIRIRNPGWLKNHDPDPWTPGSYFRELRNHLFGLNYLSSVMRIRDKHPGSATLFLRIQREISDPHRMNSIFFKRRKQLLD